MLPPVTTKNAGAVQPFGVRQLARPRPYFAPTTKPPFNMEGTTATHSARLRISCGIPESGADSISLRTSAAACTRSIAFDSLVCSSAAKENEQRDTTRVSSKSFFIVLTTINSLGSCTWIVNEISGGMAGEGAVENPVNWKDGNS